MTHMCISYCREYLTVVYINEWNWTCEVPLLKLMKNGTFTIKQQFLHVFWKENFFNVTSKQLNIQDSMHTSNPTTLFSSQLTKSHQRKSEAVTKFNVSKNLRKQWWPVVSHKVCFWCTGVVFCAKPAMIFYITYT